MTRTLKFEFTEDQANLILAALGEMPFRQSAGMIQEIQRQVAEQQPAPPREEQEDAALKAVKDDGK